MAYRTHQTSKPTTVASTNSTLELQLNKELHDSHGCAVNGILFSSGTHTTLIEELAHLSHGHADQIILATATSLSTARELLEDLW